MKFHTFVNDFPKDSHLAVLVEHSFRYDDGYGDSHSGPSYTDHKELSYVTFASIEELEQWVTKNQKEKFVIIRAEPIGYEIKTTVFLKEVKQ